MELRSFFSCWIASFCFVYASFSMAQIAPASAPITSTTSKVVKPALNTKPAWSELKTDQQTALAPLQSEWQKLSESSKRKWLEVSKNYNRLKPEDQVKLHSRMHDWVVLSPQQRAQARLNFSTAKTLTPEEKQKKWEAYQALSPEEKQKLQAKAKANTPNSAALASKPQNKSIAAIVKNPE